MMVQTVLGFQLALAPLACGAIGSGVYQTLPGATVEERGDRVPNGSRVVPFFATLTLDLTASQMSMTAVLTNAVLEGGDPFTLTVRSTSGSQLMDGTYSFSGDYLQDISPSGTQYVFDWKFSTTTNGQIVWNGLTQWTGGHIWYVTISNIVLEATAALNISRVGNASIQVTWATNFSADILEYATGLPALSWSTVTNTPINAGDRLSVTLTTGDSKRFYRLRKP